MAYEQKPNSGTLFKNERKTASNHPDYTGKWMDINGKVWNLAGWVKQGKKGNFLSLSASEIRTNSADGAPSTPPSQTIETRYEDDLPF